MAEAAYAIAGRHPSSARRTQWLKTELNLPSPNTRDLSARLLSDATVNPLCVDLIPWLPATARSQGDRYTWTAEPNTSLLPNSAHSGELKSLTPHQLRRSHNYFAKYIRQPLQALAELEVIRGRGIRSRHARSSSAGIHVVVGS